MASLSHRALTEAPTRLRMLALCLVVAAPAFSATARQSPPAAKPEPAAQHAEAAPKSAHRALRPSKDADPPAEAAAQHPSTPSDSAAQPASVLLSNGQLTIAADNSDLSTILQKVAGASGMTIQGLDKTARVFGQYGPASPRDVLTELLSDTGYNFVMLGGANGTVPRELVLTAQNGKAPVPSASSRQNAADDTDNPDADDQEPLGPGAIAHPPPEQPDDPQARMQQHLQNLERMHEAEEQQQQQQDNNQPQ